MRRLAGASSTQAATLSHDGDGRTLNSHFHGASLRLEVSRGDRRTCVATRRGDVTAEDVVCAGTYRVSRSPLAA